MPEYLWEFCQFLGVDFDSFSHIIGGYELPVSCELEAPRSTDTGLTVIVVHFFQSAETYQAHFRQFHQISFSLTASADVWINFSALQPQSDNFFSGHRSICSASDFSESSDP